MTIYTTSLCVKANALLRLLTVLVLLGAQTVSTTTAEATSTYDAPTIHAHARVHDPAVAALLDGEITDERIEAFMAEDGLTWIAGHGWGDELDAMFPPDPYAATEADKLQDDLDALALLDNPHDQAPAPVVTEPRTLTFPVGLGVVLEDLSLKPDAPEWNDDPRWHDLMTVGIKMGLIVWDEDLDAYTLSDDGYRVREALSDARAHYVVTLA